MRKSYNMSGTFLNDRMTSTSYPDKLKQLLKSPSRLDDIDLSELQRIRKLSRNGAHANRDFIDACYKKYIISKLKTSNNI